MLPSATSCGEFDRKEPIPGYKTVELLGRGGCGEVWKVNAPGGLTKAIKIVFGDVDSTQAKTEMRALTRIKDVRHPLLLSIERIEIAHGNLVIVTELADCSLKQRFVSFRESGAVGVPQDELIGYMADVAEALDYLYEKYSLQHLDVKPENILLVAERAKVGDFGLVKNLYERSVSLVGGLTPTYAPPELFEGKPTRHSDQYSLALVYMQMLTGVLPFAASNTAQLAAQHLRGIPDLSALPKRQGTVIARALSKDPAQRFASCREMVQALRESLAPAETVIRAPVQTAPQAKAGDGAPRVDAPPVRTLDARAAGQVETAVVEGRTRPVGSGAGAVRPMTACACPPTLLVGIGGTGVEVLARIVDRLRDQYGGVEAWPPVEILALDTNGRSLSARFSNDVLERVHVAPIPLVSAESYGARAGEFLKWLSRRWLYNIPRDLSTDGFRPLGRLALITHAQRVTQEIGAVVSRLEAHAAALAAASEETDTPAEITPRVVILGSICGGTASGTLIDTAYAVRSELKRRGHSDENVHGILMHSTPRSNADRDKARASAYAMLSELYHFSRPGGFYPADASLKITPFHGDNATFSQTHLLNLGEGLGQSEWELATEQAADFVYCTSFTPARGCLDQEHWPVATSARTYDVLALGAGSGRIISQSAQRASMDVLKLWREGRLSASDPKHGSTSDRTAVMNALAFVTPARSGLSDGLVARKLAEFGLGFEHFLEEAVEVVALESGREPDEYLAGLIDEVLAATRNTSKGAARIDLMLSMIEQIMIREADTVSNHNGNQSLYEQIVARLIVRTRSRVEALMEWIRNLVDEPDTRIEGARQHALAVRETLQNLQNKVLKQAADLNEAAVAIGIELRNVDNLQVEPSRFAAWRFRREDPDNKYRPGLNAYSQKRLEETMARATVKLLRIMDSEVATQIEQLDRLSRELNLLAEPVQDAAVKSGAGGEEPTGKAAVIALYQQSLLRQLGLRRTDIARKIESLIDQQLFQGRHGLRQFLNPESELRQTLARPLAEISRKTVLDFIKQVSVHLLQNGGGNGEGGGIDVAGLISASVSGDATVEGRPVKLRFVVVPESLDESQLRRQIEQAAPDVAIIRGRKSDVTFCSVSEEAPLVELANAIIGGVGVYRELAEKLHTRSDIIWSPFTHGEPGSFLAEAREPAASSATMRTAILGER